VVLEDMDLLQWWLLQEGMLPGVFETYSDMPSLVLASAIGGRLVTPPPALGVYPHFKFLE